jgi:HEPN domain-containing protein
MVFMLTRVELRRIARTRLRDAEVLFRGRRYSGAIYLCGYAIEITLKARICTTLHWPGFPESNSEWRDLTSFKTHDLDMLLRLSGRQAIRTRYLADWSVVVGWEPESRYHRPGIVTPSEAKSMIESSRRLMRVL